MIHETDVQRRNPKSNLYQPYFETCEDLKTSLLASRYIEWDAGQPENEQWKAYLGWGYNGPYDVFGRDSEALGSLLRTVEERRRIKNRY